MPEHVTTTGTGHTSKCALLNFSKVKDQQHSSVRAAASQLIVPTTRALNEIILKDCNSLNAVKPEQVFDSVEIREIER